MSSSSSSSLSPPSRRGLLLGGARRRLVKGPRHPRLGGDRDVSSSGAANAEGSSGAGTSSIPPTATSPALEEALDRFHSDVFQTLVGRYALRELEVMASLPEGYRFRLPDVHERPPGGGTNEFSLYVDSIHNGFRPGALDFAIELCEFFHIALAQLSPQSWRLISIYLAYSHWLYNEAPFSVFRRMVYLRQHHHQRGIYQLYFRAGIAWPRTALTNRWERRWFFIVLPFEHPLCGTWNIPDGEWLENRNLPTGMEEHEIREAERRVREIASRCGQIPAELAPPSEYRRGGFAPAETPSGMLFFLFLQSVFNSFVFPINCSV